jgi:hypothetical protein
MSFVLSLRMAGAEGLTGDIRDVVHRASANVGEIVKIPDTLAGQLSEALTARTSEEVLRVRRRERTVPTDVLALHLG